MPEQSFLELPMGVLENIWKHCDTPSLRNFSCCSRECHYLALPTLFAKIKIKWSQMKDMHNLASVEDFKHTRSLSFTGDWKKTTPEWEDLAQNFRRVINVFDRLKIKELSIAHRSVLDEDCVLVFTRFNNLTALTLTECLSLTISTYKFLSTLRHLKKLGLYYCHLTDDALADFHCLRELNVNQCFGMSEVCLDHISRMDSLTNLTFCCNGEYFADSQPNWNSKLSVAVGKLKTLDKLVCLDISYSKISSEVDLMDSLKSLNSLKILDVSRIPLNRSVNYILRLPVLTHLLVGGCGITDEHLLPVVGKLNVLRVLDIYDNDVSDVGCRVIANIVSLEELDISYNERITDIGLKNFISLVSLRKLNITKCDRLTNNSLKYLGCLPLLKQLCGISTSSIYDQVMLIKKSYHYAHAYVEMVN